MRSPFKTDPDPQVFYESPVHREVLETLEYAVQAHERCTIVVGEPGLGKTLLARTIAARVPAQITLSKWSHQPSRDDGPRLLIVDHADTLPLYMWYSLLTLLSHDAAFPHPVMVMLFGGPQLLKKLSTPGMLRVRRHVYRTCALRPLNSAETDEYVRFRLSAAGGEVTDIFSPEALGYVRRLSHGNPGLINRVCDRALLVAYSEQHTQVSAANVLAVARSFIGRSVSIGSQKSHAQLSTWLNSSDSPRNPPRRPMSIIPTNQSSGCVYASTPSGSAGGGEGD